MQNRRLEFENDAGQSLSAILDLPDGRVAAYALFAHCFTCSKNLKAATNISRALTNRGIAVFRFDFTGLGQSEGEFAETSFSSNVGDLLAAAAYLEEEYEAPSILVGHSLGGTAVLEAAAEIDSAAAVATINSPADPKHVLHLIGSAKEELEEKGEAEVDLGGRPFTLRKKFLDDLEKHDMPASLGRLGKPLLILHAPLDKVVEIDNATELFVAAKHPKSFVSLDDADHLLSREADSRYVGRVLAAWSSKYLEDASSTEAPDAGDFDVAAKTSKGGFTTEIVAAGHRLLADEPASAGGADRGPTPYGLLSAALAACTSMTLGMYASKKKLGLESATVRVSHDRQHAEDCEDCDTKDGRIDRFSREIVLEGELSGDERKRLLEIADRCPVHRTLENEIKIRSKLAE